MQNNYNKQIPSSIPARPTMNNSLDKVHLLPFRKDSSHHICPCLFDPTHISLGILRSQRVLLITVIVLMASTKLPLSSNTIQEISRGNLLSTEIVANDISRWELSPIPTDLLCSFCFSRTKSLFQNFAFNISNYTEKGSKFLFFGLPYT